MRNPTKELLISLKEGSSVRSIRNCIEAGAILNNANPADGPPPLFEAIRHRAGIQVIKELVEAGANVNGNGDYFYIPLIEAALHKGNTRAVRTLIELGAEVNIQDFYGDTPLITAASMSQNHSVIDMLLKSHADPNIPNKCHNSPLLMSLPFNGNSRVVKMLVDAGADVNQKDRDGVTPLHVACEGSYHREQHTAIKFLLENGAEVNARNDWDETPLHAAAWDGNSQIVQVLIEHGANVNARDSRGSTPLHEAANVVAPIGTCQKGTCQKLLHAGAHVNAKDRIGDTPVISAAHSSDVEVLRLFLDHGADVTAVANDGWTALHSAMETSANTETIQELIEAGADVNGDDNGYMLLCILWACWAEQDRIERLKILIDAGLNFNVTQSGTESITHQETQRRTRFSRSRSNNSPW